MGPKKRTPFKPTKTSSEAARKRKARIEEAPEARIRRLAANASRLAACRAAESPAEREFRLKDMRARASTYRAAERKVRLEGMRTITSTTAETPTERKVHLEGMRTITSTSRAADNEDNAATEREVHQEGDRSRKSTSTARSWQILQGAAFHYDPAIQTATNMETQSLTPSGELKHEPDYESQTMKKETNVEGKSDLSPVIKRASISSTSLSCPDEDSFLYCEKCQLKYEGGCPEHGPVVYLDNAEEGEGYCQDSSPQVQGVDNKDRQVLWREKVEQSKDCEAHSDDVGTLPNGGCSTKSDGCRLQSNVEMHTELCVAGSSRGSQSNVVIKAGQYIYISEKPFSYDACGVGFVQCRAIKSHKRTLTGEKPYKCDVCSTGFSEQGHLKKHKRTRTGEKPYKCDVCGTGFSQKGHLKIHKRTHTGEKPYKCDVCGTGFTMQGNLTVHKRTHTGKKPYKCDVCGTGFSQKGNLKVHKRTHTGERSYKCDVCGTGFTEQHSLKTHKRTHTEALQM